LIADALLQYGSYSLKFRALALCADRWHTATMTAKRLPRPRDPIQLGKLIGDILTGQVEDAAPTPPDYPNKDSAAVALGRKGGLKGGKARAEKMAPKLRDIARKAAKARWGK
jgi:hypothetical protein